MQSSVYFNNAVAILRVVRWHDHGLIRTACEVLPRKNIRAMIEAARRRLVVAPLKRQNLDYEAAGLEFQMLCQRLERREVKFPSR